MSTPPLPAGTGAAAQPGSAETVPCVRCGSAVPRSAPFCLACGTPTSTRSQAAALGAPAVSPSASWQPTPVHPPLLLSTVVAANYGRRVLAFVIDGAFGAVFTLLVALPVLWIFGTPTSGSTSSGVGVSASVSGLPAVLILSASGLYPLAMLLLQAFAGFSLGKRILGLRIVKSDSLAKPGIGRMLLRSIIVWAGSVVFYVGQLVVYLSPLWDPMKRLRGWHDRVAGTWVIDVNAGPNPLAQDVGEVIDDLPAAAMAAQQAPAPVVETVPEPAAVVRVAPTAEPFAAAPAAPAPPAPPTAPAQAPIEAIPSFDPQPTFGGEDLDGTKLSTSIPVGAVPPGTVTLLFDTGESYVIAGHGVLGRDPVSPYGAAGDMLVQIGGDTRSISKTHIEFEVQPGSLWMTDRRSTNGSAIVRADGIESPLTPGQRMTVRSGDRVRVGTRVFTVTVAP